MSRRWWSLLVAVAAAVVAAVPSAAHETQTAGALELTVGWRDEPALSGFLNAVELLVTDASGAPIADASGALVVAVSVGDDRVERALLPVGPGEYRAALVPTRPGTYTFAVTGSVVDTVVDLTATCGDDTFDCVTDAATVQFPNAEASTEDVAALVDRTVPRVERANDSAATARALAIVALVVATLALGLGVGPMLRRRRVDR